MSKNLFNCEGCITEISKQAASCPKCGHPVRRNEAGEPIGADKKTILAEQSRSSSACGITAFVFAMVSWIPLLGLLFGSISFLCAILSLCTERSKVWGVISLVLAPIGSGIMGAMFLN